MNFGELLKKILKEKKITVAELSRQTGISDSTIRGSIKRNSESSDLTIAFKLAEYLGVPVKDLQAESSEENELKLKISEMEEFYSLYKSADEKTKRAIDLLLKGN